MKIDGALRVLYRYGVGGFVRKVLHRGAHPHGLGCVFRIRNVCRDLSLSRHSLPRKEKLWRSVARNARNAKIYLTVPASWGGGAVYWLNEQIKAKSQGELTLAVSATHGESLLLVRVWDGSKFMMTFWVEDISTLGTLPKGLSTELVVSTIVAWRSAVGLDAMDDKGIADLMGRIVGLRKALGCKLIYLVHDFYSFCPRLFLVDESGDWCGNEADAMRCNECVKDGASGCERIAPGTNVERWRSVMKDFFSHVDEVRTFCNDSKNRMERVFPGLNYMVIPHPEPSSIKRKPRLSFEKLKIGVIGRIGRTKGLDHVIALAKYMETHHSEMRLTVIGWLDSCGMPPLPNVVQTGPYHQEDLPDLVEKTGVNIVLFPSTFPETFSYVMHEIMQMELPVVAFDRGAQGESARTYRFGIIAKDMSSAGIFKALGNLFEKCSCQISRNSTAED